MGMIIWPFLRDPRKVLQFYLIVLRKWKYSCLGYTLRAAACVRTSRVTQIEYCVLFHAVNLALTAIFLTGQITVNLVSKKLSLSPSDVQILIKLILSWMWAIKYRVWSIVQTDIIHKTSADWHNSEMFHVCVIDIWHKITHGDSSFTRKGAVRVQHPQFTFDCAKMNPLWSHEAHCASHTLCLTYRLNAMSSFCHSYHSQVLCLTHNQWEACR